MSYRILPPFTRSCFFHSYLSLHLLVHHGRGHGGSHRHRIIPKSTLTKFRGGRLRSLRCCRWHCWRNSLEEDTWESKRLCPLPLCLNGSGLRALNWLKWFERQVFKLSEINLWRCQFNVGEVGQTAHDARLFSTSRQILPRSLCPGPLRLFHSHSHSSL